jgi:small GTP-binding protein
MEECDIAIKMIIVGEASVGKTVLLKRFIKDEFFGDTNPTIGTDLFKHNLKIEGANVLVTFWDTAGQERVRSITPTMYRECLGALLVYDTTNAGSFEKLGYWVRELKENCPQELTVMLVGNKIDLVANRQVSTEEGRDFATTHGFMFIETSAKTNSGNCVGEAFDSIIGTVAHPMIEVEKRMTRERITEIQGSIMPIQIPKEDKGCC